jgi:hypothetical protein
MGAGGGDCQRLAWPIIDNLMYSEREYFEFTTSVDQQS